jgi:copper resistance protein C
VKGWPGFRIAQLAGRTLLLSVGGLTSVAGSIGVPSPASAGHGGVVQINRAAAGPYTLSVWTQPTPPRTGPWRVDAAVMRAGSVPVGDVTVHLRAEPLDGPIRPIEADAHRDADPLGMRYRANLRLGAPGPWAVSVSVNGPEGTGSLRFPVDVEPATWDWWVLGALGVACVAVVAMVTGRRRRRLLTAGVAVLLLASPAWPHASLVRSSPARRATLTTAPDRVQLWFNEAIEPKFSTVSVWDASDQQVDLGDARVEPEDPKRLIVGLKPLTRGVYRVRFRVLSVDGHVVESQFPFTLRL